MNKIEENNQEYEFLLELTVSGQAPRKSNARQVVGRGKHGPPMVIKSQKALNYVEHFLLSVPPEYNILEHGSLDEDLRLDIIVWYTSRRPDLSIELITDCMQKAGIIKDDRYIREMHIYGFVDKTNPRIVFRLYRISPERVPPF